MSKTFVGSFPKQPPAPKVKRKRSNKTSRVRRQPEWTEEAMRAVVSLRDHCEVASVVCNGRPSVPHHIQKRSQGGSHDPDNILWSCVPCHLLVHHDEPEARRRGWLKRRYPKPGDWHYGVAS